MNHAFFFFFALVATAIIATTASASASASAQGATATTTTIVPRQDFIAYTLPGLFTNSPAAAGAFLAKFNTTASPLSSDSYLWKIDAATGRAALRSPVPSTALGMVYDPPFVFGASPAQLAAYNATDLVSLWNFTLTILSLGSPSMLRVRPGAASLPPAMSPAAREFGIVFVIPLEHRVGGWFVTAHDPLTSKTLWNFSLGDVSPKAHAANISVFKCQLYYNGGGGGSSSSSSSDSAQAVCGWGPTDPTSTGVRGGIVAIRLRDGTRAWTVDLAGDLLPIGQPPLQLPGTDLFLVGGRKKIAAINATTRQPAWIASGGPTPDFPQAPCYAPDHILSRSGVAVYTCANGITAVDGRTGRFLWRNWQLVYQNAVFDDATASFYIGSDTLGTCFDGVSGAPRFNISTAPYSLTMGSVENGTSFGDLSPLDGGNSVSVVAAAPCAVYSKEACPMVCREHSSSSSNNKSSLPPPPPPPAASTHASQASPDFASECATCRLFNKASCEMPIGGGAPVCGWCPALGLCINRNETAQCDCRYLTEAKCRDEQTNGTASCVWCAAMAKCATRRHYHEPSCDCAYFSASPQLCAFTTPSNISTNTNNFSMSLCRWCASRGVCASLSDIVAAASSSSSSSSSSKEDCACWGLSKYGCGVAAGCSWKPPVLDASGATEYCDAASRCPTVTCEGIRDAGACRAAGCAFESGVCSPGACAQFFLRRWIALPFVLLVLGIAKDALVLLVIGAVGDVFARRLAMWSAPLKFWWQKRPPPAALNFLTETVYIGDEERCMRDGGDGGGEECAMRFAEYCDVVLESLFEIEAELKKDPGAAAAEEVVSVPEEDGDADDAHHNRERRERRERREQAFDAVAFALFDGSCWIPLASLAAAPAQQQQQVAGDDDQRPQSSPREAQHQDEDLLQSGNNNNNNSTTKTKTLLTRGDFAAGAVALQNKVKRKIWQHTTECVHYATSRHLTMRVASAVNTFPSIVQLSYYTAGLLVMLGSALHFVLENKDTVERIAGACTLQQQQHPSDNMTTTTTTTTTAPAASTTTTTAPPAATPAPFVAASFTSSPALQAASYWLLSWRFVNSSTFATSLLVFIKAIRALAQFFSVGTFRSLTIQQRLPVMSILSSRAVQLLLLNYAILVLPFSLSGVTYGLSLGWQSVAPVALAVAVLLLDALALHLFRRKYSSSSAAAASIEPAKQRGGGSASAANSELDYRASADVLKQEEQPPASKNHQLNAAEDDDDGFNTRATLANFFDHDWQKKFDAVYSRDRITAQTSIASASPISLPKALFVFFLTEELPVFICTLALQVSVNVTALLTYKNEFALGSGGDSDSGAVFRRDFNSRHVSCVWALLEGDVSSVMADLSSFVPFM